MSKSRSITTVLFLTIALLFTACGGGGGTGGTGTGGTGTGGTGTGGTGTGGTTAAVCGAGAVTSVTAVTTGAPVTTAILSLLAGNLNGPGTLDGAGADAHFYRPADVAIDCAGNMYVADTFNNTIRRITAGGVVTTLAGTAGAAGSANGTGAAARFDMPQGIATDSAGNVYVGDSRNRVIRKITPSGVVTTLAGTAGVAGSADGTGAAASFMWPQGLAIDNAGNLYVADTWNNTIRKITPAGVVTTLAGTASLTGGYADGTGAAAIFNWPQDIAIDSVGNLYVTEYNNNTIRKITPAGVVTTLAGTAGVAGSANGTGGAARFNVPYGIAVDGGGNVYVGDNRNGTIRKITAAGVVTTLAGGVGGAADGTGAAARFNAPMGVAADSAGDIYVADNMNHVIRKVTQAGVVTTFAGALPVSGSADGTGAAASFSTPMGIATDNAGNVYTADLWNHSVRKITPTGVVTTLAAIYTATGVATDSAGNVYVAAASNFTIHKVTPAGVVTTLAGTAGVYGSADGTGAAASFGGPSDVATDSAGNIYVADSNNNTIRKVTPAGVVTTLAGTASPTGGYADGTGPAAKFLMPSGVATDTAGNVYVADTLNAAIRKITPAGVVTTLAGNPNAARGSADGTGTAASFNWPYKLTTDSAGNVYVAENANSAIRKITPAGVVTTIVGQPGIMGFVPGPLPGSLGATHGIALFGERMYIAADSGIAQVTIGTGVTTTTTTTTTIATPANAPTPTPAITTNTSTATPTPTLTGYAGNSLPDKTGLLSPQTQLK